ncbi:MAG: hypothetical protein NTW72_00740 [Gemmatimonadetes bacterium]|nr:hypothetical protein [Gemmatimonadota bacterium]
MQHRHLLSNEIDLLLDGEVGFGVAPLRAHADDCAECRARLDEALVVADALERLPHFAPRTGFADRVLSQVQIVQPWHVAALDTARRFSPESRPLRAVAIVGAGAASLAVSASAVWIAFSADLSFQSAAFVTSRGRDAMVTWTGRAVEAALGGAAVDAVRSNGPMAMVAGVVALVAAVGVAAFGFRALAANSRQRGN